MDISNWDDLRYFLAAARGGSLSAAARALQTNQPTVGRRIDALEQALQVRLFHRHARGLTLTEAGERILQAGEAMDEAALAVGRAVTGEDRGLKGTVRVSAPESLCLLWLAPRLLPLATAHPEIEVILQASAATADLTRGEADAALRLYRPTLLDLVARRVAVIRFGFYAAPAYLERRPVTALADLDRHALIVHDDGSAHFPDSQWLDDLAPGAHRPLRSNSVPTRAAAAASGLGLTLLPRYVGDRWPGLVRVLPQTTPPTRELWLVTHRDLRHLARLRVVLDHLAVLFAAPDWPDP